MLHSTYRTLGRIELPQWQGRDKYMHIFDPKDPVMAEGFEDYLDPVMSLVRAAGVETPCHMTVDESWVKPGMSQRRPGAHVDGCFMPELNRWGHPAPPPGAWLHYCNNLPLDRMSIIVASSVEGCKVYEGIFDGEPKSDGDLEHIRDQLPRGVLVPANEGFLLSPDCVHESLRFDDWTQRTFLRIAFHEV